MNTVRPDRLNTPDRRIAVFCLTPGGIALAQRLQPQVRITCFAHARFCVDNPALVPFDGSFSDSVTQAFTRYDALVVIGALGITVRTLAPLLRDKLHDPAVVTIDEQGQHVISVLSGHVGGANALTRELAARLGANAVITTATDVNQVAALDTLAQTLDANIQDLRGAVKAVNQMLVSGQRVGLWWDDNLLADQPWCDTRGFIPVASLHALPELDALVCVSVRQHLLLPDTLPCYQLVPRRVVVGIGCRRDTPLATLRTLLARQLAAQGLDPLALRGLGSIDVKRDEAALLALAAQWHLPLTWFSAQQLRPVAERFPCSPFVAHTVGVGCVSQPVAWLMSHGHLMGDTLREQGVTLTLGLAPLQHDWPVSDDGPARGEVPLC